MVKDYTFRYSGIIDNVLNVIRWIGLIIFIKFSTSRENKFISDMFLLVVFFFLNPLCTTGLAYTIASNVFYRNIEVLFNPFTECLIIWFMLDKLNKKTVVSTSICFILIGSTVLGYLLSWVDSSEGLYTFYINGDKVTDPILKIEKKEVEVIKILQEELSKQDMTSQPIVIIQATDLGTFVPNVYQPPVTIRDYYYQHDRLDWNFYEVVRKHYPWQESVGTPFDDTCMYLERYNVDYLIIKYWENPEFDKASDACAATLFEGSDFKLKIIKNK
ncbi:MAG: hypothetical protein RR738_01835 [Anaerorhabdus sp.]|uniref:hypothetical protein n=1 Tax=Anaerorhabdus sp. TaxID=1872524 RepID=UPI002FCC4F67